MFAGNENNFIKNIKTKRYHRRSIRLNGYDYAQNGNYFLTLCTRNRECLFGDVRDGKMYLSNYGRPDREDEYYLLECRSEEGWDKYIGGKGMLVYHIDRNGTAIRRWTTYNTVNVDPSHQYADLIEADSRKDNFPRPDEYYYSTSKNSSKFALVAYFGGKDVEVIDLKNERIVSTISFNSIPKDIVLDEEKNLAYIALPNSNLISVVDMNSAKLVKEIKVSQAPDKLFLSDNGEFLAYKAKVK